MNNNVGQPEKMTMKTYPFYLVNVFAETHFGGNLLCVFPTADGLTDTQMQAIAKQFNLSETVFIVKPSDDIAVANLRIFTPEYEMPLAGHPTLGSGFVLAKLFNLPNEFMVNTLAKPVKVFVNNAHNELQLSGFDMRPSVATIDELSQLVNLSSNDIENKAFWVNSGSCQLLLNVKNQMALDNAKIDKTLFENLCQKEKEIEQLCLWCEQDDKIFVRFFFINNGVVVQDSGTGSACANLGAYFISQNRYPIQKQIYQGDDMERPNRLTLKIDKNQQIFVGGNVIEVGKGEFYLPLIDEKLSDEVLKRI